MKTKFKSIGELWFVWMFLIAIIITHWSFRNILMNDIDNLNEALEKMTQEKLKLTKDEGRLVIWNDHEDFQKVPGTQEIIDQRRWATVHAAIFKHLPTGHHYRLWWELGSTEMQEQEPFEYYDPELTPVQLVEKVVQVWEEIK